MSELRLSLLGIPQVQHGNRLLSFSTRKELALLLYLAVERRGYLRQKLIELLWPESDAQRGRAAFRSTLHRLHEALIVSSEYDEQPHLISEGQTLHVDLESNLVVDLYVLERAWMLTRVPISPGVPSQPDVYSTTRTQLEQAIQLARGPFLEGFWVRDAPAFDDWTAEQRSVWQVRLNLVFKHLSALQEEAREIEQAIETVQRWLIHDPLQEEASERLMRLYASQGNRTAALKAFASYRDVLAAELHAAPSHNISELAERLRVAPLLRTSTLRGSSSSSSPRLPLFEGPLIGRAGEFASLIESYTMAKQGKTQVVFIEGEAGIGKTRLVTEFIAWAADRGADVLNGRALDVGGRLPYYPLIDILRTRLERENAPDDLLDDVWLAELSRILPEVRERYPDLPLTLQEEATARSRLFEAVSRLIQAWAKQAPLVLSVDDLQWADTASLDLLGYLAHTLSKGSVPVLLLFTGRSESEQTTQDFKVWRNSFQRLLPLVTLTLSPFTAQETLDFLSALVGESKVTGFGLAGASTSTAVEWFGYWLYQKTAGRPFYLVETLKMLIERHMLQIQSNEAGVMRLDFTGVANEQIQVRDLIPTTVRSLIVTRLRSLTSMSRSLLIAAAILSRYSTFEALCQVAELSEKEGVAALEEVLQHQLLVEELREGIVRGEKVYAFVHDMLREVVSGEASEVRRRIAHRKAFELLSEQVTPSADLAYHAAAANLPESTLRYSVAAGDEALAMFAVREACIWYEQGRQVVGERVSVSPQFMRAHASLVQHLHLQLGRAYELLHELEMAQRTYEALRVLAFTIEDAAMECLSLNRLACVLALQESHLSRVRTILHEARIAAGRSGDAALIYETLWNEYQQGGAAWDQEALAAWGEQKAKRIQEVQNWLVVAQNLTGFNYDNPQMTHWGRARIAIEQAIALYQQQGNDELEACAWNVLAGAQIQQDNIQGAIASLQQALELYTRCGDVYGWAIAAGSLAYGWLLQGNYKESWMLAQKCIFESRRVGFIPLLEEDLFIWGDICLTLNDSQQAEQLYQEGLVLSERLEIQSDIELLASRLCRVYALKDDWSQALAYAERAQAARDERALPFPLAPSWYETEAWLHAGKRAEAEREIKRLERRLGENKRHRISLLRSQALLALTDGKYDEVGRDLEEARHLAETIGLPGEHWQILAALAELYQSTGQERLAEKALVQATIVIQELAERITDEELRARFLAAPQIQRVLERNV